MCSAVGQGQWPSSLVRWGPQLNPAVRYRWRLLCSLVGQGCYPGSLVRWCQGLYSTIRQGHKLYSIVGQAVNWVLRLGSSTGWALRPAGITVSASWSDWAGEFCQQLGTSADLLSYSGMPLNVLCNCLASMARLPGGAGQEPCSAVGQG